MTDHAVLCPPFSQSYARRAACSCRQWTSKRFCRSLSICITNSLAHAPHSRMPRLERQNDIFSCRLLRVPMKQPCSPCHLRNDETDADMYGSRLVVLSVFCIMCCTKHLAPTSRQLLLPSACFRVKTYMHTLSCAPSVVPDRSHIIPCTSQ